jgi:hypothetical protein
MQKLSGTSSGKNDKSCRLFSQGIQQNLVCIFLIFLRFSTDFTRFCKSANTIEVSFRHGPLEIVKRLQIYPCCADGPLEGFGDSQSGPWAPADVVRPQFRRGAAPWGRWIRRRALAVGIEGGNALAG